MYRGKIFDFDLVHGGEGEIRTRDTLASIPVFETGAINRTMRPLPKRRHFHVILRRDLIVKVILTELIYHIFALFSTFKTRP